MEIPEKMARTGRLAISALRAPVQRMDPRDAEYLFGERPGHRNHLVSVEFFDTAESGDIPVDVQTVTEWMTARLHIADFFTHRVQREVLGLDYPYWVPAPVDLSRHVAVHEADGPGWAPMQRLLSAILSGPVDLSRPPWELHVVRGLHGVHGMPGSMTAVCLKVHHCAADGLAMRALSKRLYSVVPERDSEPAICPRIPLVRAVAALRAVAGVPGALVRFRRGLAFTGRARSEAEAAERAGELPAPAASQPAALNGAASGRTVVDFTTLPLARVDTVRRAVPGATVNDVLLATVGGALRRLTLGGEDYAQVPLVAKVPRSVRGIEGWGAANMLVLMQIPLRNEVDDPLDRLAAIAAAARAEKARSGSRAVRAAAARIETSPAWLLKASAAGARFTPAGRAGNTIVSNIALDAPGRVFLGARGCGALPNQPAGDGDLLRHYLCFGDTDVLTLNICADPAAVPDVAAYSAALSDAFGELYAAGRG